jgi:LysM repeat protein
MKHLVALVLLLIASSVTAQSVNPQASPTPTNSQASNPPVSLPPNFSGHDPKVLYAKLRDLKGRLIKGEFETTAQHEIRRAEELHRPLVGNLTLADSFALLAASLDAQYDADAQTMHLFLAVKRNSYLESRRRIAQLSGKPREESSTSRKDVSDLSDVNLYNIEVANKREPKTRIFFDDLNYLSLSERNYQTGFLASVKLPVDEARRLKSSARAILLVQFQEPYAAGYESFDKQFQVNLIDVVFFDPDNGKILARLNRATPNRIDSVSSSPQAPIEKPIGAPTVEQVIQRANDHFRKGKLNLEDNKPSHARDEFDKAVDAILMSGLDIRANPQLQAFYLELVERIYREEVPLKAGRSGLIQNPTQPASNDPLSKLILTEDEKSVSQVGSAANTTKVRARKGDTIAKIAAARNLSVEVVVRLNGIGANTELQPGQEIKVPLSTPSPPATLTDEYLKSTREYKASLEKLLVLYQTSERKAEERLAEAKTRFAEKLIQQADLTAAERAVLEAKAKVEGVRQQIATADKQLNDALNAQRKQKEAAVRMRQSADILRGPKPAQLPNGTVPLVLKWFQESLHDPYSARYVHWSKVEKYYWANEPCWVLSVRIRAKNAFGAYVLSDNTFYIRQNRIIHYQRD